MSIKCEYSKCSVESLDPNSFVIFVCRKCLKLKRYCIKCTNKTEKCYVSDCDSILCIGCANSKISKKKTKTEFPISLCKKHLKKCYNCAGSVPYIGSYNYKECERCDRCLCYHCSKYRTNRLFIPNQTDTNVCILHRKFCEHKNVEYLQCHKCTDCENYCCYCDLKLNNYFYCQDHWSICSKCDERFPRKNTRLLYYKSDYIGCCPDCEHKIVNTFVSLLLSIKKSGIIRLYKDIRVLIFETLIEEL